MASTARLPTSFHGFAPRKSNRQGLAERLWDISARLVEEGTRDIGAGRWPRPTADALCPDGEEPRDRVIATAAGRSGLGASQAAKRRRGGTGYLSPLSELRS